MDWTEQTNAMIKTWGEAQRQLWGGWMDWAQNAAGVSQAQPMLDPTQWLRAQVDTWSGLKDGPAQRVMGNVFGTPEVMTRSLNLLMSAWKNVAPKIAEGKPWQPDLKELLAKWQEEVTEMPKRAASVSSDFAQLSRSMFEKWTPMTAPWLSMVNQATAAGHPGAAFMGGTEGLGQLLNFQQMFQAPLSQMNVGELPRATVVREKMGKFLKVMDSVQDLKEAQKEYQKELSAGLSLAVERTIEHLAKLAEKGEKVSTARDLMRTWYSIADKTLMERFNTEGFLKVQDKLTLALMKHKKAQREALEIVYNSLEIPTRSEIDEAYKDIHELKREVRALRRALKDSAPKAAAKIGKKVTKEAEASESASS